MIIVEIMLWFISITVAAIVIGSCGFFWFMVITLIIDWFKNLRD